MQQSLKVSLRTCIDLTRMECKEKELKEHQQVIESIDLTRMECKGESVKYFHFPGLGIDLTRMECKVILINKIINGFYIV